jgi:hypothetical protein
MVGVRPLEHGEFLMAAARRPLRAVIPACLGCLLFPAAVVALALTYVQNGDEPGPWPYSAVDYLFYADLGYTILLIWLMRGWRGLTAMVSIPLLFLTAWLVALAGMWFTNNYL